MRNSKKIFILFVLFWLLIILYLLYDFSQKSIPPWEKSKQNKELSFNLNH